MGVCPRIDSKGKSCPHLLPCPVHPPRDKNASWSKDRNTTRQASERTLALRRDGFACVRCGHHDPTGRSLDVHHVSPDRLSTLCNPCHCAVDPNARRR